MSAGFGLLLVIAILATASAAIGWWTVVELTGWNQRQAEIITALQNALEDVEKNA